MMSDEDVVKAKIKETIKEAGRNFVEAQKRGAAPKLVSFDDLFSKTLYAAARDPRIDTKAMKAIKAFAQDEYRVLARATGASGDVIGRPDMLRGLLVHISTKVVDGEVLECVPYADEKQAVGLMNDWLKDQGAKTTVQDIRLFEQGESTKKKHPLTKKFKGSGVLSCPIQ